MSGKMMMKTSLKPRKPKPESDSTASGIRWLGLSPQQQDLLADWSTVATQGVSTILNQSVKATH